MNIKAAALQQHFTTYELSKMPDIVRDSPEALEYCIWLHNEAIEQVEALRAVLEQISDNLDAEEHEHIHRIIERVSS